jgi:hypothetical protein
VKPMKQQNNLQTFGLSTWLLLPLLCLPQCVDEDDSLDSRPDGGGGGETRISSSGSPGQAGESWGPILICGKRTKISQCDPISIEPCPSGTICEHSASLGGYKCFDNPQPAQAGEFCDNQTALCGPGLYCEDSELWVCQHYCCEDSDCTEGKCYGGFYEDGEATIGFCFEEYGGWCQFDLGEPGECDGSAGAGGSAP